ncbi:unnamed protein product [Pleuronectes platessa]|uniref:Uncharacterized protein n=1 Tax=Pleuronectes platessa TaxID=8262 RepID=A0A9N7VWX6_PLEPL|nr:unnamed protein product [Pleuronectes platessa]
MNGAEEPASIELQPHSWEENSSYSGVSVIYGFVSRSSDGLLRTETPFYLRETQTNLESAERYKLPPHSAPTGLDSTRLNVSPPPPALQLEVSVSRASVMRDLGGYGFTGLFIPHEEDTDV